MTASLLLQFLVKPFQVNLIGTFSLLLSHITGDGLNRLGILSRGQAANPAREHP
jgi:hypothetical protein